MAISSFCSRCGAESAAGATHCAACQHPLALLPGELDETMLLHGRYQLLKEIGAGGFGAVYQARDTQEHNRLVAIKQIHLQGLTSQEIIEATDAFNREAEILSTLHHPLLPEIFDRFSDPEHWYLVLNFIDGLTLDEYLQQQVARALPARRGLPLAETLTIALQLCGVLHYLHTQQPPVIFRDLKPGNVMRTTTGGRLYLIDFGIARRFKPGQAKDTVPFGSPGFAAPEQYGRAQTTPQADIYSLGALLYCLISSDDPADHPFQFPPLRLSGSAGIHELDALIQRMVATDPAQRPADLLEVRTALLRIQQIQAQATDRHIWMPPPGQTPPATGQQQIFLPPGLARRKTTRRRVITGSLVAGGALLFGGLAFYSTNNNSLQIHYNVDTTPDAYDDAIATSTAEAGIDVAYWSSNLEYVAFFNGSQGIVEIYTYIRAQNSLSLTGSPIISDSFSSLQWSPDSKYIIINNNAIWSMQEQKVLFSLPDSQSIPSTNAIAWSPNGKYLAVGRDKSRFQILDALDGTLLFQQSFSTLAATSLAWTPDSKYVIVPVADTAGNWHLQTWDVQTRQKFFTLSESSDAAYTLSLTTDLGQITALFCAPDQQRIAFLCGNTIWLCNMTEANSINVFNAYSSSSSNQPLVWAPNAKYLATITDQGLLAYDATGGYMIVADVAPNLVAFAWSADSKSITAVDNQSSWSQFPVKIL